MNVGEFKALLSGYPDDMHVVCTGFGGYGYDDVDYVDGITIVLDNDPIPYEGEYQYDMHGGKALLIEAKKWWVRP